MLQFILVFGRHQGHVGQVPQIGDVKGAVVGRAVAADNASPVKGKGDRQVLQADIVKNLVIGPLQKTE